MVLRLIRARKRLARLAIGGAFAAGAAAGVAAAGVAAVTGAVGVAGLCALKRAKEKREASPSA